MSADKIFEMPLGAGYVWGCHLKGEWNQRFQY